MIVVSLTSWKGRIDILGKSLFHFMKTQTVKPNKIFLTLSSDEFKRKEKDLPADLLLIINAFGIQVNWIKENIFGHKKYEVFKYYNNETVILIDDDLIYPADYIEKLVKYSKKFSSSVICYYTCLMNFENGKRKHVGFTSGPSSRNVLLSGLACYPPHTFPLSSFKYSKMRDTLSPKCDDSWINGWLIKNDIMIVGVHDYNHISLNCFPNTQKNGIWKTYNSKSVKGTNQKYINLSKVLNFLGCEHKLKKIWPNMNIKTYSKF